jgi:hypothetical protein
LEQRKLKTISEETQAIANERMQLENANRKYEKKLKELRNVHKQVCRNEFITNSSDGFSNYESTNFFNENECCYLH